MELVPPPFRSSGEILVVTGKRGSGKTTYCQKMVDLYRSGMFKIAGLLSLRRYHNLERTGIIVKNLESEDTRLLASLVKGEVEGLRLGPWHFDPLVLDWGNRILKNIKATDLLVIDELGPLEFRRQSGWTASFDLLKAKQFGIALVVIRPECLRLFSKMGFNYKVKEIIDKGNFHQSEGPSLKE
jgi:nucleoside-triphosphatase